jgi:hypothetical protein
VGDFYGGGSQICSASRLLMGRYCSHQVTIGEREGPLYDWGSDWSGGWKRKAGGVGGMGSW